MARTSAGKHTIVVVLPDRRRDPTLSKKHIWLLLHASRTRFAPTVLHRLTTNTATPFYVFPLQTFPPKMRRCRCLCSSARCLGRIFERTAVGKIHAEKGKCAGQLLLSSILAGTGIFVNSGLEAKITNISKMTCESFLGVTCCLQS